MPSHVSCAPEPVQQMSSRSEDVAGPSRAPLPSMQMLEKSHVVDHSRSGVPKHIPFHLLEEITNGFSDERKLGSGAYGKVYMGVHSDGEKIAVKMLYDMPGLEEDKFLNEFNNLARLHHPNIVRLVGYCYHIQKECAEYKGRVVLAERIRRLLCFEYMRNGSLDKYISDEDRGLDWKTCYTLIKGICKGLKYLHEELEPPIYHLDLKPANILLDENMLPKIADFGLSRFFGEEQTHITKSSVGTCGYLPPEYIERNIISSMFDIFSLGVVIIKIMTGHIGYIRSAEMPHQKFVELAHENWRIRLQKAPRHLFNSYSNQVKRCMEIALKCVEADRYKRPSIGDIVKQLNETESETDKGKIVHKWHIMGKYELGRTIAEGTFTEVKTGMDLCTGRRVTIKILDKNRVLKHKMVEQVKREILTMKLIMHWNVVQICEVLGSKTKIYIVFDSATNLFDTVVQHGRMKEGEARWYFQQLIDAVDYCHSKGVYHRNLKPENLLLDIYGNLKVSDFGLSVLSLQIKDDGLLHTTCGTSYYVAPEVPAGQGYDGAMADVWSCGVILFVMLAGYMPFEDFNLMTFKNISNAELAFPLWISFPAKRLLTRMLDPNSMTRITIPEILEDEWFKQFYRSSDSVKDQWFKQLYWSSADEDYDTIWEDEDLMTRKEEEPVALNAFQLISMLAGLNLESLFDSEQEFKEQTRFISKFPPKEIVYKIEEAAKSLGFDVQKENYKLRFKNGKAARKGNLDVFAEILQVAPDLHMVEVRKAKGDTLEFHKFYKDLSNTLEDVVWKSDDLQTQHAS